MSDRVRDVAISVLLFAGTIAYLHVWPHDLYGNDEGFFLYESKRVLDGDVMYRDFFDIFTPGSHYLMALWFALFGLTFETARMGMAVLHGLIAVLLYRVCLRIGTRRPIAAVAGIAHVAICYAGLPFASPHWFGTGVALAAVLLVLRGRATNRRALGWGMMIGILILVEQHKGAVMAVAVVTVLGVDHLLERESHPPLRTSLVGMLALYVAGVLVVAAPVLLAFLTIAGVDPVLRALVYYPMVNYRGTVQDVPWGWYWPGAAGLGVLLKYLPPSVIPVAAARVVWQWRAKDPAVERRPLIVAVIFAVFGLLSIAYLPDSSHIALVGPLWVPLVAELLDRCLRRLDLVGRHPLIGPAVASLLIVGLGVQLHRAWRISSGEYSFSRDTAFGRIDFRNPEELLLLDKLEPLLRSTQAREIFVYPCYSALYLLAATPNATRYQTAQPGFVDRSQLDEIVSTLETRRVPFVIRNLFWWPQGDPLMPYLQQHYRAVPFARGGRFPTLMLFQRQDTDTGSAGPGL